MGEERRLHQRFVIALAVEMVIDGRRCTATTKDISVSGCCLVGAYPLPEGGQISCSLYLVLDGIEEADLGALETRANVQWAVDNGEQGSDQRYMAGLKFEGLKEPQQDWLKGVIAKAEASAG